MKRADYIKFYLDNVNFRRTVLAVNPTIDNYKRLQEAEKMLQTAKEEAAPNTLILWHFTPEKTSKKPHFIRVYTYFLQITGATARGFFLKF